MSEELENEIAKFLKIRDDEGNNLLHYVVKSDNVEFAKHLIAAGCDVNTKNESGDSPLALAIEENQLEMVKILLKSGATFESRYFDKKYTPLHCAAEFGYPEIVQLLIESGADVNAHLENQLTALHLASMPDDEDDWEDNCRIMRSLIDAGADISAVDKDSWSSLAKAIARKFDPGCELLVSMGANINTDVIGIVTEFLDYDGYPDNVEYFKHLVKLGYDINASVQSNECSLLHVAAFWSLNETIKFLLSNGAVIKIDGSGFDPLCFMLEDCTVDYVDFFDENDQEIEEIFNQKIQILNNKHMETIDLLIKHGTNVNHVTNRGLTSLYIVFQSCPRIPSNLVRILLKNGANFDFNHPLTVEVMSSSNKKIQHLLLKHTAMFEAQNRTDGPLNFNLNNLNEKLQKDYARCRDELELMKSTMIDDTNVSFFDILVKKDISPYMRNESITSVFEATNASKSFPTYSDILCERFAKEIEYQSLVQEATNGLGYILNWDQNSMHLLLSNVLRYLDRSDLTNLALI